MSFASKIKFLIFIFFPNNHLNKKTNNSIFYYFFSNKYFKKYFQANKNSNKCCEPLKSEIAALRAQLNEEAKAKAELHRQIAMQNAEVQQWKDKCAGVSIFIYLSKILFY